MLRGLILFSLIIAAANAAIFPDQIGDFQRSPVKSVMLPDKPLNDEYGLESTEQAQYKAGEKHFEATAWRFKDSTGAMAFFEARRPPAATPSKLSKLAVSTSDGGILAYANYVFQFTGDIPASGDLDQLYGQLPRLEQSPLPTLMTFLPPEGLIANSERYIVGPVSLERFDPGIPPSVAAFHLGTEAQLGKFDTPKGPLTLAIFNYPTPNLARQQAAEFEKLAGAVVKRTGPLVAVTLQPPDPDAAERVLAKVEYEANLVWNDRPPGNPAKQLGGLFLNIFALSGVVGVLGLAAGIGIGAFRVGLKKLGLKSADADSMITLHLDGK